MEDLSISIPSKPLPDSPLYLDYLATSPLDPIVLKEMMDYLTIHFGNPTSSHFYGKQPRDAIIKARQQVADLLGCSSDNIVFTSGGSESNSLAIKGGLLKIKELSPDRDHIITSAIEHPAVSRTIDALEGYRISKVACDKTGRIFLDDLKLLIEPNKTAMVSIMLVNNEVGTIQPIKEIAELCKQYGIIFHSDAAQATGKIPINVKDLGVDLLSIAGHKIYGPKGVGALYCKGTFRPTSLILGSNQECGLRSGTSNVSGIVGLGKACELLINDFKNNHLEHIKELRDKLENGLLKNFPEAKVNGNIDHRIPIITSIGFPFIKGFELLKDLGDSVCFSAGAACNKGTLSPTLQALHVPSDYAVGTIRLSIGRYTTEENINSAINLITKGINEYKNKK